MSQTPDTTNPDVTNTYMANTDVAKRRKRDFARLRAIGTRHGAAFLAAITLWGAADVWASTSGLMLAQLVALLNAIFAGVAMSYLAHEWGHFSGARLSGAVSPVLKEPTSFFMFNFKQELNSRSQFLAMSAGGPAANWSLALLVLVMLPIDTPSQAMLLATVTGIAVSVSVFEFPIINRVMYGNEPEQTIRQRQREIGNTSRWAALATGAVIWLIAV